MSDNNLSQVNSGNTGFVSQVNQYFDAFKQSIFPRNSAGVPTDSAGSIGSAAKKFLDGFFSGTLYSVNSELSGTAKADIVEAESKITLENTDIEENASSTLTVTGPDSGFIGRKHETGFTGIDLSIGRSITGSINDAGAKTNSLIRTVTLSLSTDCIVLFSMYGTNPGSSVGENISIGKSVTTKIVSVDGPSGTVKGNASSVATLLTAGSHTFYFYYTGIAGQDIVYTIAAL